MVKLSKKNSGITAGTKFAPPYACTFTDEAKTRFLETHVLKPLLWFR